MDITYSTPELFLQPVLQGVGTKGFWLWRKTIYRLVQDYVFEWGPPDARKRIWMAKGFEFDKASVPFFSPLLGIKSDGENDAGSMFHDRFWRDKGKLTPGEFEFHVLIEGEWVPDNSTWKKRETNDLFQYMTELGGLPKPAAATQRVALEVWPPNWFKGF